jgi:polar amino acid transport system substrate-binding protein
MIQTGEAQGIFPIAEMPSGDDTLYLSRPVVQTGYAIFVAAPSALVYHQPMDLQGYTIGVPGPTRTSLTAEEVTRGVPGVHIVSEVNDLTVLKKLASGHYQSHAAVLMNRDLAIALIRQQHLDNLKAVGDVKAIQYRFGLAKTRFSAQQADQFNAALDDLMAEGKVRAVLDRYGLQPATSP